MSRKAKAIQNKLWKAYGKVGKILGLEADIFRLDGALDNPLQDRYWHDTQEVAISADDSFNSTLSDEVKIWVNGKYDRENNIAVGDFVRINETSSIYVIVDADLNLPLMAYSLDDTVTVERSVKTATATDYDDVTTVVVENYPVKIGRAGGATGGFVPAASKAAEGIQSGQVFAWAPEGSFQRGDVLIDQFGVRLKVMTTQWSSGGKVTMGTTEVQIKR